MTEPTERESLELARRIGDVLVQRRQTLGVVETSAGGALSHTMNSVPGSSRWYVGGIIAYSAAARQSLLGMDAQPQGGSVSIEHAIALAARGRRQLDVDWCVSETGIAGPAEGRRSAKRPGLVCVAVVSKGENGDVALWSEHSTGADDRVPNQRSFAAAALRLLSDALMA